MRLKEWLTGNFIAPESMRWEEIDEFKKKFDVKDDQLHRILMEIYDDAQEKRVTLTPKTSEWNNNNRTIEGVLGWLPKCGDIPVKEFLMSYATTKENDSWLRRAAILSYLRLADPGETKNALLRFLVEGERMDDYARSSIYVYAKMVWDTASPERRRPSSMRYVLHPWNRLTGSSKMRQEADCHELRYKDSIEREAMLRHQLTIPFSPYYGDLKEQMEKEVVRLKKLKNRPAISTNIAALKARDFNLPLPDSETNEYTNVVLDSAGHGPRKERRGGAGQQAGMVALLGGIAAVLLGYGLWRIVRK